METDEVNKPVNKRKHNNGESDERSNSMNEDSVMKGYNDTVTVKQTKDSSLWIGGGEVGEYLSKLDWEHHPMGPVAEWPQSLQTAMSILLTSRFSMTIWWGTEFLHVYNDAFIDVVGRHKHPQFLGRPGRECWADVWPIIEPMMKSVVETGVATWLTDHFLPITTHGILEERYFTYSYSPLRIEGGKIGGVFNTVQETTSRVLSERQLKTLKDLAAKGTDIHTVIEASKAVLNAFETNTADLPFGICYLTDERMTKLELTSSFGIDETLPIVISEVILGSPTCNLAEIMERVYHSGVSEVMDITDFNLPSCGKWNKQPKRMTISPLVHSTHETPAGILLMGVNQMKILDDNYLSFYSLIANQVATTLANARAHEEERKRAEMLAELDKAKTIFFSNISHEFRTPLTLMLGPLEDMLSRNGSLTDFERENLQLVHRNSLRLLKLVNALLDFSRIEAGRAKANYECVDLSVLTIDLASVFRAACQKEGIDLIVTCPPLCQTVYVDTDMWEKIVLNLLSNAFKFTFKGSIEVKLTDRLTYAELTVTDTGTGIPAEELPKLFERFHRVQGSQGRTHEGTGIGLALVNELAKLHGGSARVESTLGVGTKFIIEIPYDHYIGKLKDKNKNIQSGNNLAQTKKTYTRTASWWMPNLEDVTVQEEHVVASTTTTATTNTHKYTVLLVDDNADMRDYVGRLLCEHYTVILGSNGEEGYKLAVAKNPDVVLTDIMMPVLDGYGLLRALRSNDKTKTIPVIFLSARAGEESKVEGLQSGADDYLVKPFTARELLARVKSHLDTSQLRLIAQKQAEKANEAKDHFLAVLSHELRTPLTPALMLADSLASNPDVPEKIKEDLQLISRNIQLEVHLIDDLLDLTKITKGKLVLNNQFISVHELIGFAYRIVHHDCLDKNIRVDIDLRATLFNVEGDPPRIQQILWNLLKNAVKFTPKGGLITIKSYNVTEGNKDYIHVQVSDSGIGIPPEALPKIFNSFEQGGKDITNQFGGLGLGLAISKALALMHNGTLSAASEGDGKGATFELELPTANSNRVNLQLNKIQMEESVSPASLEILMVEDNKPTLMVMERFIKKLGYNVTTAMSVSEAFDAAKSLKFDLVISDIGLPDGTGHDLIQKIKSLYSVKAIALSGYGMDEDIKKSISAGFDIHVTKPVQLSVLQAAINNVLSSV